MLARIEPISAVWTTTTRPACRAKIEMNSSGRLPRADWRMPGRRRPEALAELVGPLPDQRGEGGQGDGADDEDDRLAGAHAVEAEGEDRGRDRDDGHDAGGPAEDRGQGTERVHRSTGPGAVTRPSYRDVSSP